MKNFSGTMKGSLHKDNQAISFEMGGCYAASCKGFSPFPILKIVNIELPAKGAKAAFSLAEFLIALFIIGVVAAMTLPTLFHNIIERQNAAKVAVFNSKFIAGLNSAKAADDIGNQYSDTYDFLKNGLSKHLNMISICDGNHLNDCFGYDEIQYKDKYDREKSINILNLKNPKKLNIKDDNFSDSAAFVLSDGTPVILTYNKNCVSDGLIDSSINACVAGLFDINGTRRPNMFVNKIKVSNKGRVSKEIGDLRSFNNASVTNCIGYINDLCISGTMMTDNNAMYNALVARMGSYEYPTYTRPNGQVINDNWTLSQDYCKNVMGGNLPSLEELGLIASALYGRDFGVGDGAGGLDWSSNKDAVFAMLGISTSTRWFRLWGAPYKNDGDLVHDRGFGVNSTDVYRNNRGFPVNTICVDD